ncbi:MAG: amidase family protein [Pseudomonadota bacterium]
MVGYVVAKLESGEVTPLDTLDALEARISQVDGQINALPTLCFERARDAASALMNKSSVERGVLQGLPVPIKDLDDVGGVRCTYGSKVFENHVPEKSCTLVETLEGNGAVIYAKSNTPEFGAGGNTFNDVLGTTRNPHNLALTPGGSSGGAAAALASGTAWLAQGSDLGGSLRTPASFCGVTSLRPSPGLIATGPKDLPFEVQAQCGPMARDVNDLSLFADAMTGIDTRTGVVKSTAPDCFREAASRPVKPLRVAFSEDLGVTSVNAEVAAVCQQFVDMLSHDGVDIDSAHPDFTGFEAAFDVPRALGYAASEGDEIDQTRALMKPEVVWNIEHGLSLDGDAIRAGMRAHGTVFNNAAAFMQDYDLLVCPAANVLPFPVEERYVGFGAGEPWSEYFKWLKIAYAITTTSLPVITIPAGRSASGLPVGVQLIGKPHGEAALFSVAAYLESLVGWDSSPIEPVGA